MQNNLAWKCILAIFHLDASSFATVKVNLKTCDAYVLRKWNMKLAQYVLRKWKYKAGVICLGKMCHGITLWPYFIWIPSYLQCQSKLISRHLHLSFFKTITSQIKHMFFKYNHWVLSLKLELSMKLKWIQIQFSQKDNSCYRLNTLGPLCLWQCFLNFSPQLFHIFSTFFLNIFFFNFHLH